MPLYDYRCETCGNQFEMLESMQKNGSRSCHVCGGKAERVISTSSLKFTGSGFRCTDYGRFGRINKEKI